MSAKAFSIGSILPRFAADQTHASKKIMVSPRSVVLPVNRSRTQTLFGSLISARELVGVASALSLVGTLVLTIVYLAGMNGYAATGYDVSKHQTRIRELTEQQKQLLVQQAEVGSLTKTEDIAAQHQLVSVTQEEFLTSNQVSSR